MIGLDTAVLVRPCAQDEPEQPSATSTAAGFADGLIAQPNAVAGFELIA